MRLIRALVMAGFFMLVDANHAAEIPALGDGSGLYFHWGNWQANDHLFTLGGGHQTGGWAEVNEAVLKQSRDWYSERKADAAGPGFYITPHPLSSKTFGDDLVIMEIFNGSGRPLSQQNYHIKRLADAAMDQGDYSALPFMTLYSSRPDTGWYVISRSLSDEEKKSIQVPFRIATVNDAPLIWKKMMQASTGPREENFFMKLVDLVADEKSKLSTRSRPVLEAALMDSGAEILEVINPLNFSGKRPGFDDYQKLTQLFLRLKPQARETHDLVWHLYEKLTSDNPKFVLFHQVVAFFHTGFAVLLEDERASVLDYVLK